MSVAILYKIQPQRRCKRQFTVCKANQFIERKRKFTKTTGFQFTYSKGEINMENNRFVIAVYVDNTAGVLTRVTAMFTRRGFNIDALTVGETEHSEYSRITIAMRGDDNVKQQLINQLKKLYVVKKVQVLDDEPIKRELMLIKVENKTEYRSEIMTAVDVFRASVIDYSPEGMCIEVTGAPSKIDAFVKLMQPFGILEMCRTGVVALDRGTTTLLNK
jgi:acetolactate synthase-1/3 small subunit